MAVCAYFAKENAVAVDGYGAQHTDLLGDEDYFGVFGLARNQLLKRHLPLTEWSLNQPFVAGGDEAATNHVDGCGEILAAIAEAPD